MPTARRNGPQPAQPDGNGNPGVQRVQNQHQVRVGSTNRDDETEISPGLKSHTILLKAMQELSQQLRAKKLKLDMAGWLERMQSHVNQVSVGRTDDTAENDMQILVGLLKAEKFKDTDTAKKSLREYWGLVKQSRQYLLRRHPRKAEAQHGDATGLGVVGTISMDKTITAESFPLQLQSGLTHTYYPEADSRISDEHLNHFEGLVNLFKGYIEKNRRVSEPRDRLLDISYDLWMCGTSIDSARPSIVISFPKNYQNMAEDVYDTLTKANVLERYALEHAPLHLPTYDLYVQGKSFWYKGWSMNSVDIHLGGKRSLCGSPITYGPSEVRLSTVGCVVIIGSDLYALTSAHPFEPKTEPQNDLGTLAVATHDNMVLGVGGYGSASKFSAQSVPTNVVSLRQSPRHIEYEKRMFGCNMIRPYPDQNQPNLDWSLIKLPVKLPSRASKKSLGEEEILQVNSFTIGISQQSGETHYVGSTPSIRPSEQRRVRIIVSHNKVSSGIINRIPTYISNSSVCDTLCEVWTVSGPCGKELQDGDCGSLVVDEETNEAYGHVIAVDSVNRIFVIPLINTLQQIRHMFYPLDVELFSKDQTHGVEREKQIQVIVTDVISKHRRFSRKDIGSSSFFRRAFT